jgi:hypothetical protein
LLYINIPNNIILKCKTNLIPTLITLGVNTVRAQVAITTDLSPADVSAKLLW